MAATDPEPMLEFLHGNLHGKASNRKQRLLACAYARPQVSGQDVRRLVEPSEDYADGRADQPPVVPQNAFPLTRAAAEGRPDEAARLAHYLVYDRLGLARGRGWPFWDEEEMDRRFSEMRAYNERQIGLLRDIFGNPFRPVPFVAPAWLAWNDGTLPQLARAAYEERQLPKGTLDHARLAVLADALEEAGCADADLIGHLRGPGPHVRGCWALDLVLGKE